MTPATMSSNATTGVEKRARRKKRKRTATVAMQPGAQSALPGISDDVVIAQNLGKNVNDPTDLARLRAVSYTMHAAVAATGHGVKKSWGNTPLSLGT